MRNLRWNIVQLAKSSRSSAKAIVGLQFDETVVKMYGIVRISYQVAPKFLQLPISNPPVILPRVKLALTLSLRCLDPSLCKHFRVSRLCSCPKNRKNPPFLYPCSSLLHPYISVLQCCESIIQIKGMIGHRVLEPMTVHFVRSSGLFQLIIGCQELVIVLGELLQLLSKLGVFLF